MQVHTECECMLNASACGYRVGSRDTMRLHVIHDHISIMITSQSLSHALVHAKYVSLISK